MIQEINEIILWFRELPAGYPDINEMLHNRQKLAGHLFAYAVLVGDLRKQFNYNQANYENELVKWEMRSQSGPTKAKIEAKANCSNLFKILKDAEGDYYSHIKSLDAIKEVLDSMSQSIAHQRDESKKRNMQQ